MSPLPFFLFIFRHFGVCNQHIILFCFFRWRRKTKFKVQNIMKKEELYTLHTKKRMDECGVRTHLFVSVCINQNEFLWMNFFVRKIKCVCMRLTYKSFVACLDVRLAIKAIVYYTTGKQYEEWIVFVCFNGICQTAFLFVILIKNFIYSNINW